MYPLERAFVTSAERSASALGADAPDYARLLGQIKESAKTVNARGIIAAANVCERVIETSASEAELPHALATLNRLIGQYASGLREIDPEFENLAAQSSIDILSLESTEDNLEQDHAAQTQSVQLLGSLMPLAREGERSALEALVSVHAQPALQADSLRSAACASAMPQPRRVLIESLMTPITNAVLSCAHRGGKSVSLSYAVSDYSVSPARAAQLKADLIALCTHLVETAIAPAQKRAKAGLARTGQISITAFEQDGEVAFEICDNGTPLNDHHFDGFDRVKLSATPAGNRLILAAPTSKQETAESYVSSVGLKDEPNLLDVFEVDLMTFEPKGDDLILNEVHA